MPAMHFKYRFSQQASFFRVNVCDVSPNSIS